MRRFFLTAFFVLAGSLSPIATTSARDAEPAPASEGRVTVWSGVSYQDLAVGTGARVRAGQTMTCHATGWLSDGTKFWSSHDDGNPIEFNLRSGRGGVIPGWVDGIPGMKVGGKRKLWVPAELAYGEKGFGTSVPPGSDLVFEVEVVSVKAADPTP